MWLCSGLSGCIRLWITVVFYFVEGPTMVLKLNDSCLKAHLLHLRLPTISSHGISLLYKFLIEFSKLTLEQVKKAADVKVLCVLESIVDVNHVSSSSFMFFLYTSEVRACTYLNPHSIWEFYEMRKWMMRFKEIKSCPAIVMVECTKVFFFFFLNFYFLQLKKKNSEKRGQIIVTRIANIATIHVTNAPFPNAVQFRTNRQPKRSLVHVSAYMVHRTGTYRNEHTPTVPDTS
ncbi:unnamed protein product [Lactuca saligna]|uniref:Uncharacterized protein n=1 Tax=Lactuca saligna TaxID=75948 RepID=A0AA35Z5E5_LACSI|nr:unnamed protein product [Lactuca saligna]